MTTLENESCVQSKYSPLLQSQAMPLRFPPQKCLNPEGGDYHKIGQIRPDCKAVNNGAGWSVNCQRPIALFHTGQHSF